MSSLVSPRKHVEVQHSVGLRHRQPWWQDSWRWEDGRRLNFTAWAPHQPNNFWWGERCVRSLNQQPGDTTNTWDDHRCWLSTANVLVCQLSFD